MTQIVELKLGKGQCSPGEAAQTVSLFAGERTNRLMALSATVV
jgi:hypothetical protein